MPWVFRLWFGLVAVLALMIVGLSVAALVEVASLGPEGIGRAIGAAVREFNRGMGDSGR